MRSFPPVINWQYAGAGHLFQGLPAPAPSGLLSSLHRGDGGLSLLDIGKLVFQANELLGKNDQHVLQVLTEISCFPDAPQLSVHAPHLVVEALVGPAVGNDGDFVPGAGSR